MSITAFGNDIKKKSKSKYLSIKVKLNGYGPNVNKLSICNLHTSIYSTFRGQKWLGKCKNILCISNNPNNELPLLIKHTNKILIISTYRYNILIQKTTFAICWDA